MPIQVEPLTLAEIAHICRSGLLPMRGLSFRGVQFGGSAVDAPGVVKREGHRH